MKKTIGFLSGSGPEAWLYMCHCLHNYLQREYNAVKDQDYVDYILYNRPLKWFDETGIADFDEVLFDFKKAMLEINNMGVSYIGIACNTLHLLLDYLDQEIKLKVVNMVEETVRKAIDINLKKVLILSSNTTNYSNLYGFYCDKYQLCYVKVTDDEQRKLDIIIEKVMWSTNTNEDSLYLNKLVMSYIDLECIDGFVLWCTELPLAFKDNITNINVLNANDILVHKLVDLVKN